ncbi:MAG: hypothetical protein HS116_23820 [Planctomycetes bacterium]|nr:hypothetical protein [Planctomycetota bacterium]
MSSLASPAARSRGADLLLVAALVLGGVQGARHWWYCDDAFIGYRYAQHLAAGEGLVFNPGERVEGYTDLLWVLWNALPFYFGSGPEVWANLSGLTSYVACLGLLGVLQQSRARALYAERAAQAWPLAALAGALHPDWNDYATSGIETTPFALAVLAAYAVLIWKELTPRRAAWAGALFGVATLLRPEGLMLGALGGLYVLWQAPRRLPSAFAFAAAIVLLWGPAQVWRMLYYGDFWPNTYYAKSAELSWYSQGAQYTWSYLAKYWTLLALPPLAVWVWKKAAPVKDAAGAPRSAWPEIALALALWGSYVFSVLRVGGDFMYARLFIHVAPLGLVALERLWECAALSRRGVYAAGALILVAGPFATQAAYPYNLLAYSVADEARLYSPEVGRQQDVNGLELLRYTEGVPVRVLIFGSEARIVYRARLHDVLEGHGLTDRTVARRPLAGRGRPGHEKIPTLDYVLIDRKIQFLFRPDAYAEPMQFNRVIPYYTAHFGSIEAFVLTWDPAIMRALWAKGVRSRDFLADLDAYLADLPNVPRGKLADDYARFWNFYFAHTDDPARERPFLERLGLKARPSGLLFPERFAQEHGR